MYIQYAGVWPSPVADGPIYVCVPRRADPPGARASKTGTTAAM